MFRSVLLARLTPTFHRQSSKLVRRAGSDLCHGCYCHDNLPWLAVHQTLPFHHTPVNVDDEEFRERLARAERRNTELLRK